MATFLVSVLVLVFATACLAALLACVRPVRARTAQLFCDRRLGHVRRMVVGPSYAFVSPLLAQGVTVNLLVQHARLSLREVATADLPIGAEVDVFFAFDPDLLAAADLDEVMPLFGAAGSIVRMQTDYCLRNLAAGETSDVLLNRRRMHAHLTHVLQNSVQAGVASLGVCVSELRLLVTPSPSILIAQSAAAARAVELDTLANVLGRDHPATESLLLLKLLHQTGSGRVVATLNLSARSSGDGSANAPASKVVPMLATTTSPMTLVMHDN